MPYSDPWDETSPVGNTTPAKNIDEEIRKLKLDLRERLAGIFGLTALEFAADPIAPKILTLLGNLVCNNIGANVITASSLIGPLTGNVAGNVTGVADQAKRALSFNGQQLGVLAGASTAVIAVADSSSWVLHAYDSKLNFLRADFMRFTGLNGRIITSSSDATKLSATLFNGTLIIFNNDATASDIFWFLYRVI